MPSPSTSAALSSAKIYLGRVIEVDASRWRCRVYCRAADKELSDVMVPSLYCHPKAGEGIHYLPEVNSWCYVCDPSDSRLSPFIIMGGACAITKDASSDGLEGSHDMNRPVLNPGDIALHTRDGNGLALRRGGVTELRGTSLSKIVFDPTMNRIMSIAENWTVHTFGGACEWKNLRREENPDGVLSTRYTLKVKEFATSKGCSVKVTLGSVDAIEAPAINLQTGDDVEAYVEGEKLYTHTLASSSTKVAGQDVATLTPGTPYTFTVKTIESLKDSARVVDFRIYKDETKDPDSLEAAMNLGMDREGDIQLETDGAIKIDASSKWVEIVVGGSAPLLNTEALGARKVLVTTGSQGSTEPVLKGHTFMTDLALSLTEISLALKGIGIPTPTTDDFLANVLTSVTDGSPYLSTTLESE